VISLVMVVQDTEEREGRKQIKKSSKKPNLKITTHSAIPSEAEWSCLLLL